MKRPLFSLVFLAVIGIPALVHGCPLIDGLVDVNCDQALKIGFVGDSFVKGVGDRSELGGGYVSRLNQLFPSAQVVKYPKPGIASGELLSLLMRRVPRMRSGPESQNLFDSDYVIVDVGRNDYWVDNYPPRTLNNIKRIVAYLKTQLSKGGRAAPVIGVATLAPTTRRFQASFINSVTIEMLSMRSASKLPAYIRMDKLKESGLSKDGIHPNSVGYERLATFIQAYLGNKAQSGARAVCIDADSDGIYDKFESSKFGTNSLLADTDGDGFLDGAEIFSYQTDPLDPLDFPSVP